MPHEILDHTADIGIKVYSDEPGTLFSDAAQGLTGLLVSGEIEERETLGISICASTLEELFHDWLSEINYLASVHGKLFRRFQVEIEGNRLRAICSGDTFRHEHHRYHTEIKAVTYHQLVVKKENGVWHAQVFFDL